PGWGTGDAPLRWARAVGEPASPIGSPARRRTPPSARGYGSPERGSAASPLRGPLPGPRGRWPGRPAPGPRADSERVLPVLPLVEVGGQGHAHHAGLELLRVQRVQQVVDAGHDHALLVGLL